MGTRDDWKRGTGRTTRLIQKAIELAESESGIAEFFRSWRRMIGAALLLMACVLMSEWLTSLWSPYAWFNSWEIPSGLLESRKGGIEWWFYSNRGFEERPVEDSFGNVSFVTHATLDRTLVCAIPYWSIVPPMALLSAYLLIITPRAKTTVKSEVPSSPEI